MKLRDHAVVLGIVSAPLASMWVSAWLLNRPEVVEWFAANPWARMPLNISLIVYGAMGVVLSIGSLSVFLGGKVKL